MRFAGLLLALLLAWGMGAGGTVARASGKAEVEAQFRAWVEALWPEARAAGITRRTFQQTLSGVSLDWELPDLRPPGRREQEQSQRQQPEFSSPGRYFNQGSLESLVRSGRAEMSRWESQLDVIEQRFAVPRGIILAIWARETGYGRVRIPHDAISTLATQAFMGRRKQQFRGELLLALRILQEGHVDRARMKSSWAGALGLPQFLPSDFFEHAVDFDGDGARDIWSSVPDTLASIGRSLKAKGWRAGMSWGYEVELPDDLDCTLEGPHQGMPVADWVALGVRRTFARSFSERLKDETGYLLLPAGRYGPAFIVTDNFYVLKKYNESDVYALFVGHLADRYYTNRSFAGQWRGVETFRRDRVRDIQERLIGLGLDVGGADGLIGFKTRVATGLYEKARGMAAKCYPTPALMRHIRANVAK